MYNSYNLEASFKQFLLTVNPSNKSYSTNLQRNSVRYYLSDLRHFIGWAGSIQITEASIPNLSGEKLELYKEYLIDSQLPTATINRRLSTIRKFYSFCLSQGWTDHNPTKNLSNLIIDKKPENAFLSGYEEYLRSKGETDLDMEISYLKEFFIINLNSDSNLE